MPVNVATEIAGVKQTLRELSQLDKKAAYALRKEARTIMQPIVIEAQRNIPEEALTGMNRTWVSPKTGAQLFPWNGGVARTYVKAKTSTKKPYEFQGVTRDLAVFYISWAGGVNMLFDMAGRKNQSVLAANLTGKFGPPSRIMYPAAEKEGTQVEEEMARVIDELVRLTNQRVSGVSQ